MLNLKHNVTDVLGYMARFDKQYRFAVAKALTDTARDVHKAMPAELEKALDKPKPFTKAGFYITPARKDKMIAVIAAKDMQAEYLKWQVEGGTRRPDKNRLRLPSTVQLDAFGNIPRGLVKQLVRRAEMGKKVTAKLGTKAGISSAADIFYGKPKGGKLPAGIWKRENGKITPVIVFPEESAKYRKRFDFHGVSKRIAVARFKPNMAAAWALAKATAK